MLREHRRQLYYAWMASDVAIAASVFIGAVLVPALHGAGLAEGQGAFKVFGLGVAVVVAWPLILGRCGVYRSQRRESMGGRLAQLGVANGIGALVVSTLAFATEAPVAPAFPFALAGGIFVVQTALRLIVFGALEGMRRSGRNYRNVLVIGAGPRALLAKQTIDAHPEWGLRIRGYLEDGGSEFVPAVPSEEIYKYVDLPRVLREMQIDEALVACPRAMLGTIVPAVRECTEVGVPVTLLTDLFGDDLPPPRAGNFGAMATLSFAPVHHNEVELSVKRAIDLVGAAAALVLSAPVVGVAALAVRLSSAGPVFFRQIRCGQSGRRFTIYKLRTMGVDAEDRKADLLHLNEMDGPVFKMRDDPRVTRVGRWLRRWSIDELPQLWNVLKGDMSLVGPRPPTPDEVVQYQGPDRRRLSMRPGLTCLWQVRGRSDLSFSEWMKLDLEYIDTWSLGGDLRILAQTMPQVIRGRGAR